jgi:hypothetical protein
MMMAERRSSRDRAGHSNIEREYRASGELLDRESEFQHNDKDEESTHASSNQFRLETRKRAQRQ